MLVPRRLTAVFGVARRCVSTQNSLLLVSEKDGVRSIVMNSPKTRNALSDELQVGLLGQMRNTGDTSLRCIVLSAAGPVFSSGLNLKQLAKDDYAAHKKTFDLNGELNLSISQAPVPVIAVVNGVAAAAGCQLAAACDIVVASDSSLFSTPGATFGLFCSGAGVTVSRSVGRKTAAKMVLTGIPLTAEEALSAGLITHVCSPQQLDAAVDLYVSAIKSKSRAVVELGKRFFYQQLEMSLSSAYEKAAAVMADNLELKDGREGLSSFVEKRPPQWKHTADQ